MTEMFLDLHLTGNCNLHCLHCYLSEDHRELGDMPFEMAQEIIEDYMTLKHPVEHRGIILSGGEPTMYLQLEELIAWVHEKYHHKIRMASNGYRIQELVNSEVLWKNDGIQIDLDGDRGAHEWLRGKGSYAIAVSALKILQEHGIHHSIMFTAHSRNVDSFEHVLKVAGQLEAAGVHINEYHPLQDRGVQPCGLDIQERLWKKVTEHGFPPCKENCYHLGCIGGLLGCSVLPDGTYWNCSRDQTVIGKYPQRITECLNWEKIDAREALPVPCRR